MEASALQSAIAVEEKVDLSVVVPLYNEENNVEALLKRLTSCLDHLVMNYELVMVNDGSTDRTLEVLTQKTSGYRKLKIITYDGNKGKGYAVREGVMRSVGSIVMFIDGDQDISLLPVQDFLNDLTVGVADLILASKVHPLSEVKVSLRRRALSRIFNIYVQLATGIKLTDTQVGLKAGKGDILRQIFSVMTIKRYAFDVELLAIAIQALNMRIKELPVQLSVESKFRLTDMIKMFIDVIKISYRMKIRRNPYLNIAPSSQ
jgi:dolichyl-phosphate beta-glucosyltransferase